VQLSIVTLIHVDSLLPLYSDYYCFNPKDIFWFECATFEISMCPMQCMTAVSLIIWEAFVIAKIRHVKELLYLHGII
jgi:hypothetical protein